MKEQMNFSTSRESGTSFENDGQVDLHAANENLLSLEEVRRRRQQAAFEHEALGRTPESRPLMPHEQLGRLNLGVLGLRRTRIDAANAGEQGAA